MSKIDELPQTVLSVPLLIKRVRKKRQTALPHSNEYRNSYEYERSISANDEKRRYPQTCEHGGACG